jgi:hypothetical protein
MLRRGKSAPGMSLDRGSGACLIGPRAATRLRIPNGAGKDGLSSDITKSTFMTRIGLAVLE